jgi:tellurite resistance protein TerC
MNIYDIASFGGFFLIISFLLFLDLGLFHKDDHVVTFKESAIWTSVWVGVASLFGVFIYFFGEYLHGVDSVEALQSIVSRNAHEMVVDSSLPLADLLQQYRSQLTLEYFSGYLIEFALSVDNIFVMIMIFVSFGIDQKYYHRVLFWGILGAVVLRLVFIFLGAALIHQFEWILAVFGAIIIVSGLKMLFEKEKKEKFDTENHAAVKFVSKFFPLSKEVVGHDFFVKKDGKWYMTTLFLVLCVIEFSDIIFAVDSIPTIFSVTQDPYIVFFSNIFAIMGLRSLFFMMNNVMNMFSRLKTGLGVLLIFIGVKMLLHFFCGIKIETAHSLIIIISIIGLSILASILFPKKEEVEEKKDDCEVVG